MLGMWRWGGLLLPLAAIAVAPVWPTSGVYFLNGEHWERFIQPTESGELSSGLFGATREGGRRFHEGVDIAAEDRNARGIVQDRVFAVLPGRVVYVNHIAGKSTYGIYVVLEHDGEDLPVYSLYAHLAKVAPGISPGVRVEEGALLGVMGNTSGGYVIPQRRAHLHFEMGVRLSDDFQRWYNAQKIKDDNEHGVWNGMNLVGFNPLAYFARVRARGTPDMADYVREELPTAFTVLLKTTKVPDFVRRYPALVEGDIPVDGVGGWEVDFTWYGLPKCWRALLLSSIREDEAVAIVAVYPEAMPLQQARQMVIKRADESYGIGRDLQRVLEILGLKAF